ncbi:MAG: hypothetical protein SOV62_07300 [Alloprevotella sp.]|nr:hypothetical protein [Alloprevotella sp.]
MSPFEVNEEGYFGRYGGAYIPEILQPCVKAFGPDVDVVGVNNRDLRVFRTDPARSSALRSLLPAGTVCISESGLLDPLVSRRLAGEGFNGFLIGEAFMKTPQPGEALRQYLATMLQA